MKTTVLLAWVIVLSTMFYIVFHTAYMIDEQNKRLNELHSAIQQMEADIAVLESEWSYLSRTERIESLARQHLKVDVPHSAQLASFSHLSDWLESTRLAAEETQPIRAAFSE